MYNFDTAEQAEAAANAMYKVWNPEGTTEMLYGYLEVDGKFVLQDVDRRFQIIDGQWVFVEPSPDTSQSLIPAGA